MGSISTPLEHPFAQSAIETAASYLEGDPYLGGVNYYTDGSIYWKHLKDVPIVICGPGEPSMAHQPDEWVDVQNYLDSIRFYIAPGNPLSKVSRSEENNNKRSCPIRSFENDLLGQLLFLLWKQGDSSAGFLSEVMNDRQSQVRW